MGPKVAIILINLNQEVHTRECITSLFRVSYANKDIILIDNCSTDGSGSRLSRDFPTVIYEPLTENLGFPGGNNRGIELAISRGADYVLLLNNDTVVDVDFIQPLVELGESNPHVAAQCCKIFYHPDRHRLWYAGGIFNTERAFAAHRGIHEIDSGQYDTIEDTDFASGCMLFVPSRVVQDVGVLDQALFAYYEDADWCLRAKQKGYRIVYNPRSKIWHKVSTTNKIDGSFYLYFTMRNKIIMHQRYSATLKLSHILSFASYYIRYLTRIGLWGHSWVGTKAILYGIVDGLRTQTGRNGRGRLDILLNR